MSVLVTLALPVLLAAPPAPFAGPQSDVMLAGQVKAALSADPATDKLNLVVSVVDRVAVVGGPVADAADPGRVEKVVRARVPGLEAVRVSCWVVPAADPLAQKVGDRLRDPTPFGPALPPSLTVTPRPAEPGAVAVVDRRPTGRVTVQRAAAPAGGFLLDPVGPGGAAVLPMPALADAVAAYPTIPPPAVPEAPEVVDVAGAVDDLRATDRRFAGVTAEVRGGVVRVGGSGAKPADRWAFAAAVRKVPGVTRVVVAQ